MYHIHPVEIKNEELKKITTTPFARSETRFITPVTVNYKDVGGLTNDSFVLCDSPSGFEDTSGPEVDIANGFGIVKAIKGNYEDMKVKYFQLKEYFIDYIKNSVEKLNRMFQQEKLYENDLVIVNSCVRMLETVRSTFALQPHISKKDINDIYENLLLKIETYFEDIVKKIDEELKKKNAFYKLEHFMKELDSIREISIVALKTTPSYYSTLEKIVGNLSESKRNAEQLLTNLFEAARNVDYDELTKCLLSLNSAKWIEKYRPEDYSDVISDVKKKLIEHIKNMKVSIKDMTLDLEDLRQNQLCI
ncbi:unnamed protein product [Rotaria sp. Silwood2]|nr:unnamed protein product [Rotaria sp. Silwood2]